jgi:hypothetical protein
MGGQTHGHNFHIEQLQFIYCICLWAKVILKLIVRNAVANIRGFAKIDHIDWKMTEQFVNIWGNIIEGRKNKCVNWIIIKDGSLANMTKILRVWIPLAISDEHFLSGLENWSHF